MNVWMKRTLQTGLFTGGLLALGTGIASADDSTVDVTVPITVSDNAVAALGTAGDTPAEIQLPALDGTVAVDLGDSNLAVPITLGGNAADVAGIDVSQPAATPATGGSDGQAVDADMPVTVTGNAVGVLGTADASSSAPAAAPSTSSAAVADVDAPVTACGNGIGVLGDANGDCSTPASTSGTGGDPTVGAAAPATACGNGVGVLGDANGDCTTPASTSTAPGMPGTPIDPTLPPIVGQPGAFRGIVAPAASGLPVPAGGSTTVAGSSADGELASTGSAIVPTLLVGLLALALGLGLTVLSRRRVSTLR
jgi:hypothetical protein